MYRKERRYLLPPQRRTTIDPPGTLRFECFLKEERYEAPCSGKLSAFERADDRAHHSGWGGPNARPGKWLQSLYHHLIRPIARHRAAICKDQQAGQCDRQTRRGTVSQ